MLRGGDVIHHMCQPNRAVTHQDDSNPDTDGGRDITDISSSDL